MDILKEYIMDEEGSFDPVCFFAKRNFKIFATIGPYAAMSIPLDAVPEAGPGPKLILPCRTDLA